LLKRLEFLAAPCSVLVALTSVVSASNYKTRLDISAYPFVDITMQRDEEAAAVEPSDANVHLPEHNVPRHGYGKMHDEDEVNLPSPAAPQTAAASPAAGTQSPTGAARFQSLEPPKTILPSVVNVSDKVLFKYIILGGSLLAFNAGYMNCVALQSHVSQVVSHVTGHATKVIT
jgi:hypothetical protein